MESTNHKFQINLYQFYCLLYVAAFVKSHCQTKVHEGR